jgi:indolepyruvate ferredoxin oxidoreductase
VKSNCVAVQPLDTEFGRKRTIDQSSCNKDYSCLEGFCPSFVTVHGGRLKKGAAVASADLPAIPEPELPPLDRARSILITGVGGTGVVTIGAVIGMAAHLDGLGVGIIDMSGLAQKGGAVSIHMRLGPTPESIHAIRIGAEEADVVLGCDIVVTGSKKALAAIRPGESQVYVNLHETYPGDFMRDADLSLPTRRIQRAIEERVGAGRSHFIEAERLARSLIGDAIATNMLMVGFAWQQGKIPISHESMLEAIRLNGVEVEMNRAAFEWGRRAAFDLAGTEEEAGIAPEPTAPSLDQIVARRVAFLTNYKSRRYAMRYKKRVEKIATAEKRVAPGETALSREVAHSLFKLMAIKDEYEVARLFADGSFERQLREEFESWEKLEFHLAPPLTARRDKHGHLKKKTYGPGMMRAFKLLARLRFLRGTLFDPFGRTRERRWERKLLRDYLAVLGTIEKKLSAENWETASALAAYPQKIRGFGHVKEAQARPALAERDRLMAEFLAPTSPQLAEAAE